MRGFCKVVLAGNLTRDPEVRTTPSGASVCSFAIAVNRHIRLASGEERDQVSFFDCTAWSKTGETIAKFVKKGSPLLISGRLEQRTWDDKETGKKRSAIDVIVEDFTFISGGNNNSNNSNSSNNNYNNNYSSNYGGSNSGEEMPQDTMESVPEDIPNEEIDVSDIPF